jgi:hypothetical protein
VKPESPQQAQASRGWALSERALSERALSERALSERALSERALRARTDSPREPQARQALLFRLLSQPERASSD